MAKGNFKKKITGFFEQISSKPKLGGLQITDSMIQYAFLEDDSKADTASVKLPPGVVSGGKIRDEEAFLYYLNQLHALIKPENSKEKVRVVVSLPSAITYTQNYDIPNVGENRLEEAAQLNLEMISPIPAENAYMSWQLVNETEDKFKLLGAFAEAQVVDQYRRLLDQANFSPMIFEFPSLSLSWTINKTVGSRKESFLVLSVSSDGIDIFLLKNGSIYFDYFRSWRSIQGERKQISRSDFDQVVIEEVRKVVNFTSSRFNEALKYVFVVAPGLANEMKQVVESNFNVQAAPLTTKVKPLAPSWYTVLGSAIRGSWDRSKDRYVSLGTYRVEDLFYREQVVGFINLWRNIFVGLTVTFLVIMTGAYFLLKTQPETLQERLNLFNVDFQQSEVEELRSSAEEFNSLVAAISEVRGEDANLTNILEEIRAASKAYSVLIDSMNLSSSNLGISLLGRAPSYEKVIDFKNALISDPRFKDVNMPFSKIVTSEENFVSFEVSFRYDPSVEERSSEG